MKGSELKKGTTLYRLFLDDNGDFYFISNYIHPTDYEYGFRDLDWKYYNEEDLQPYFPTKKEAIKFLIGKLNELGKTV